MRIANVALFAYNEGWTYHENMLPKYYKILGNDVWTITTNLEQSKGEAAVTMVEPVEYINEDGVNVIRLSHCSMPIDNYPLLKIFKEINPNMIFFHNMNYYSIWQAIKYKKINKSCQIILDNHQDEYNTPISKMSLRGRIAFLLSRINSRLYMKSIDMVYGVTPGRAEYAKRVYGVPQDKIKMLPMGTNPINYDTRGTVREKLASRYDLNYEDFWVVCGGGRIDEQKGLGQLIQAFKNINRESVNLIVFGSISATIQDEICNEIESDKRIKYIGFLSEQDIDDILLAGDLGVFCGTHSVLWEQAVGSGLPCIFRKWNGMEHVDIGGNCIFVEDKQVELIENALRTVYYKNGAFAEMKRIAVRGMKKFSYYDIAKKSIELSSLNN